MFYHAKANVFSGGMGLTGGIADVGSLYESLLGIHTGRADDSILDKYDEVRRQIWHDIINPGSSENMRRLIDIDPEEVVVKDPMLRMLVEAQKNPEARPPVGSVSNPSSVQNAANSHDIRVR